MRVLSPEEENRKDIDEFMGKIDSTLAQTKKYVAKSQNSFEWVYSNQFFVVETLKRMEQEDGLVTILANYLLSTS